MARLHKIYDGIYISGIPKLQDLERHEITAVVNVIRARDSQDVIEYAREYTHYEIPDGKNVKRDLLMSARNDVLEFYSNSYETVIHCRAGRNRSATVAALAILELAVVRTGAEAVEYVRERRPNAIANPAFEEWLNTL